MSELKVANICQGVDVTMLWKQRLTSYNRWDAPALAEFVWLFSSYWI